MNKNLAQMLKVAEGRYLAETEKSLFKQYYESLPQRLAYAEEMAQTEDLVIKNTLDAFYQKYPDMLTIPESRSKSERDMAYLLRTVTTAMVQNDYSEVVAKVKFIFDIFARLNFTPGAIDFAYDTLREQVKAQLSNEAASQISGFMNVLHAQRLAAWQEMQDKHHVLVEALKNKVLEQYPQVQDMHSPEENLRRDMTALLQACGQAMVSQTQVPVNDLKAWLYRFFDGLQFEMDVVYNTYANAHETLAPHLSHETLDLLKPHLQNLAKA
jgi:hypothetical protein